jgi:hypothetical protein
MSIDLVFDFLCFFVVFERISVRGAFGINCRMSDAFCLSWLFNSWSAFL